jgi:hypothetical protein
MLYFDRVCAVEVSPDIKVEDLRIKFEVKKNIQPNLNSCKIEIYNLSTEVLLGFLLAINSMRV